MRVEVLTSKQEPMRTDPVMPHTCVNPSCLTPRCQRRPDNLHANSSDAPLKNPIQMPHANSAELRSQATHATVLHGRLNVAIAFPEEIAFQVAIEMFLINPG